jgi:acetate---CoA ligase (ADP-forming)
VNATGAIEKLFYPKSIAVIGASDQPDKFSGRVLKHLIKSDFKGAIFPVNPNRKEVQGVACYANVRNIPAAVDVAVVMVPNSRLFEALEDCRSKETGVALVLNSGFAESGADGKRLQERLGDFAAQSGVRVCGPNCNGYVNVLEKLIVGTSGAFDRPDFVSGDIAFLAQSGGIAGVLLDLAQEKRIGVSYCVSVGNEADLDVADFIEYLAVDRRTKVIALFVEGVKDGRRFLAAVDRARARGKFIVACKAGRSAKGREAASAHTGKLAGSFRVWSEAMRRSGVAEAADLEELVETANLLSRFGAARGKSLAILTLSGGQGVLLADLCESAGIKLPAPLESAAALREGLPEFAALTNPIDLTGQASGNPEVLERMVVALAADSQFDAVLVVLVASPVAARLWTERIAKVAGEVSKPVAVLWSGGRGLNDWRDRLLSAKVPVFEQATVCVRSLDAYFGVPKEAAVKASAPVGTARDERALKYLSGKAAQGIAEPEAKELAKLYGIPVPREILACSEEEAVGAFRELGGPVAMKVISPAILHRSDGGFVRLGISTAEKAGRCYSELVARASARHREAALRGILIQEMIRGPWETLAGISHDPQFGPVVLFGAGGVAAELLSDVALRLCPLSEGDCREMIAETKIGRLLGGYRGGPEADVDAVVNALMALSELATGLGKAVKEMDINPLIVKEKGRGAVAVDVRLVTESDETEERLPWR